MPDLYAVNLCLQERPEQDWPEGVRAVDATHSLDKAGLLQNQINSFLVDPGRRLHGVNSPKSRTGLMEYDWVPRNLRQKSTVVQIAHSPMKRDERAAMHD